MAASINKDGSRHYQKDSKRVKKIENKMSLNIACKFKYSLNFFKLIHFKLYKVFNLIEGFNNYFYLKTGNYLGKHN